MGPSTSGSLTTPLTHRPHSFWSLIPFTISSPLTSHLILPLQPCFPHVLYVPWWLLNMPSFLTLRGKEPSVWLSFSLQNAIHISVHEAAPGEGGNSNTTGGGWSRLTRQALVYMDHTGKGASPDSSLSPSSSGSRNGSPVRHRIHGRVRGLPKLMAINALVCGVEIVSSAAFTYIPPLLLKAGYTETVMTIILGIGKLILFLAFHGHFEYSY